MRIFARVKSEANQATDNTAEVPSETYLQVIRQKQKRNCSI